MNQIILDNQADAEDPVLTALGHEVCRPSASTTTTKQFLKILRGAKPELQIVFQRDHPSYNVDPPSEHPPEKRRSRISSPQPRRLTKTRIVCSNAKLGITTA